MRHRPVYAIEILELRVAPAAIIELTVSNLNGMDGFRISGERMDDLSGRSVSGVGDVNGDGLDDLLIGAVGADNASGQSTGAAYVLFGTIAGFAPNISLSSLDGSNGFKIVGNVAFDSIGWAVGAAGDVNGDGFRDLLIGAPDADPNAVLSGATYVVFGKGTPFPRELNLSGLNGANGFRLSGQAFPDQSGRAVSGAGDINGDGFDDLLVGAMYVDANGVNSGASYVVFGKQFGFTANINLATLNGIDGFKISGASSNDYAGRSVGTAGDINGDGFDDLVVGAHFADANGSGSGAAYVILGKANGFPTNINVSALDGVNGFTIAGANSGEGAGISVGTAGDVNGDGLDDLLVGAFAAFRNGLRFNGAGYVVFGNANGFPANFTLSTVNGSNGFQVTGAASYDSLGYSSSKAGDVNGDGFDDVIISATGADSNGVTASGASYVIFGKAAGFAPTFSVSTLNGIDGFTLKGVGTYDSFGLSVSGAGDLNGDGIDDVVIGAPRTDFGRTMSGASYVVFGRSVTSVSVNDAAVEEDDAGSRVLTFTATLSEAATELLTLHYSTENRTAQAGSDFTGVVNQSLIFEPGDLSKTIAVTISGDTTHELDETFAVVFSPQAGVRFLDEIASGTISNDDASPIVSVGDGKIVEGNSGITALAFPIALSAFSGLPVAVQYVTADGTALAGRDYSGISAGMVEFAPGETAKTITVDVVGETLFENDEIFSIVLSVATGAVIGGATGTGTIQNEDVMPRMSIAGGLLVEGASGMGELTFTAALSAPSGLPATVQVAGANETAKAGSDFIPLISHALTFAPGETAKTITVQVFGDVLYEDDETFSVALSGAIGAVIEDGSAIGTIRNDDDAPLVTIAGGSLGEGDSGTSTLTFLAALSAPSGLPATVQIASADGTAFAGTDFIALTPQVLNFAPGETIKTISVEVLGETIYERDETFAVLLSGATGVGIDDGIALGTIQNDDTAPLMSIADGSLIEGNSGTSNLTFTAALSAPSGLPATVQIASGDGTALAGTDFIVLTPQVLTFAPGETIKTISIDVFGDTSIENHRHFSVTLSDAGGATIQRGTAIGTILNDDTALLISDSPSNREGHTGSVAFPFDVTLVQASALPVTVRFATVDASASGGSDFIPWASGGEITFVPGETQKTIAVDVLGDADSETHEQFSVILSEPINAPLMRAIGTATILNDDALVQIGEESLLEGHAGSRTLSFTVSIRNETVLAVRVNVAAVDGTAAAGSDYALLGPGILEFAPGEVGKTVVVDVLGDLIVESNETFSLRLSDPVNAVIADEQGVATILDDDVTLAGPRKATFTDVDGENVTIKISKGTLKVEDFTIFPSGFGAQLALIDFSGESEFAGADLTITSKAPRGVASGDRVAHVGHINAAGIDLGKVRISGVLGQIDAGDALTPKRGIASLSAQSIGRSGLLTQLPGGSLQSDIDGALKTLRLADGIHDASLVVNGSIGTIDITGGVIGSAIRSEEAIGTIRISGDFAADATITARGRLDPASSSHSVAIGSIAIGGSVEDAQILAGYDLTGAAVNADVGIGTVRVRGNWIASDLVAGAIAGADARIGTDDDEPIFRDDAILSKIASVVIKGEVLGSDNGADHFGFVAEEIAAFKVAGNKLAFTPGARNDLAGLPLGPNADVRIREVA